MFVHIFSSLLWIFRFHFNQVEFQDEKPCKTDSLLRYREYICWMSKTANRCVHGSVLFIIIGVPCRFHLVFLRLLLASFTFSTILFSLAIFRYKAVDNVACSSLPRFRPTHTQCVCIFSALALLSSFACVSFFQRSADE